MPIPKILIVDDNQDNVDLIAYFLRPQNYDIRSASDGVEAINQVELDLPDLILLDIRLPRMDGFEVCEKLKKNDRTRFIPIIMITASQDVKHKIQSLEAGADDFISQPFENIELVARVKSLLRIKAYQDELNIKNKELEEKNKLLVRMDQFKEELSHLIVHDMKNPLFVIQGNLQMLSMTMNAPGFEKYKKYVNRIERSSENLLRMVTNLVDIAKIEDGSFKLSSELTNINDIIEKCKSKIQDYPEHEKKAIHYTPILKGGLMKADSSILERVFDNLFQFLLNNVEDQGLIEIKSIPVESGLMFELTDNGTPLPLKYTDQIFNKFSIKEIKNEGYRVGRGLGMTFCKLAVEAHHGWIRMNNTGGVPGNRIEMFLPINK